jgi:hypothetical protein
MDNNIPEEKEGTCKNEMRESPGWKQNYSGISIVLERKAKRSTKFGCIGCIEKGCGAGSISIYGSSTTQIFWSWYTGSNSNKCT